MGRRSLWLIVSAAFMPLLLFAIFQVAFAAQEQRRLIEAQALNLSEQLIIRADAETGRIATILDALATSQAAAQGDWPALQERYQDFVAFHPDLQGLTLRDTGTKRTLFTTGETLADSLLVADGKAATRPLFVGYARSATCRCLVFERQSETEDGQLVTLVLLTNSDVFTRLLPPPSDKYAAAAFNGPKARFIARSVDQEGRFGTMSSTYLQQAVASGKRGGIYRGLTLEQIANYTAFTRSQSTGWTAHVALGSDYIDGPARRFLISLSIAALLSLSVATLLIVFAIRQMRKARAFTEKMQQTQKLEALGQLTGGLAHDFNNLLTPVIGTLDQLSRRESLDARGRRLAAGALASAQRAAKLTSQLLAFSRRQKLSIVPVPVQRLVADVAELIERSLGARHPLNVQVDPAAVCVASDGNQLEVALLNLALNARDASPEGSPILLEVRPDEEGHVLFELSDRGSGMDKGTQSRALEPFFTTKQTGQGTGLGLAQVFGLVTQSGGSMTIDSRLGEGTKVTLRLPACDEEEATVEAKTSTLSQASKLLRLLVVDDDPAVRATIAGVLMDDGHSVEAVASGASALALLRENEFDLVVVDFLMPGMTGAELIQAVASFRRDVRFLLVSGYADTEQISGASDNTDLLRKPFTPDELRAAVVKSLKAANSAN